MFICHWRFWSAWGYPRLCWVWRSTFSHHFLSRRSMSKILVVFLTWLWHSSIRMWCRWWVVIAGYCAAFWCWSSLRLRATASHRIWRGSLLSSINFRRRLWGGGFLASIRIAAGLILFEIVACYSDSNCPSDGYQRQGSLTHFFILIYNHYF